MVEEMGVCIRSWAWEQRLGFGFDGEDNVVV